MVECRAYTNLIENHRVPSVEKSGFSYFAMLAFGAKLPRDYGVGGGVGVGGVGVSVSSGSPGRVA